MNPYLLWYLIGSGVTYAIVLIVMGYTAAQDKDTDLGNYILGGLALSCVWPVLWLGLVGWQLGKRENKK